MSYKILVHKALFNDPLKHIAVATIEDGNVVDTKAITYITDYHKKNALTEKDDKLLAYPSISEVKNELLEIHNTRKIVFVTSDFLSHIEYLYDFEYGKNEAIHIPNEWIDMNSIYGFYFKDIINGLFSVKFHTLSITDQLGIMVDMYINKDKYIEELKKKDIDLYNKSIVENSNKACHVSMLNMSDNFHKLSSNYIKNVYNKNTLAIQSKYGYFSILKPFFYAANNVVVPVENLRLLQIIQHSYRLKRYHGITTIIIDNFELLEGNSNQNNREREIEENINILKVLANCLDVNVILINHHDNKILRFTNIRKGVMVDAIYDL